VTGLVLVKEEHETWYEGGKHGKGKGKKTALRLGGYF
jgi:hypothetical protein